jgi:hypothetical protein
MSMKLITKEVAARLSKRPLYSTDKQDVSEVLVKFFNPFGSGSWYVLEAQKEADGDWTFFGLVDLLETELGYFTLSQLTSVTKFGRPSIERDMYFDGYAVNKKERKVEKVGK